MSSRLSHAFGALVIMGLLVAPIVRAEVTFSIVSKDTFFVQQGPTTGDVIPDDEPFFFRATVGVENKTDLTLASVRRGGSGADVLRYNGEDGYAFDLPFATLEDLEAAYPPGGYLITYNPRGGSAVSWLLYLLEAFPEPPLLEDWFDLQHIVADQDVTIGWSAFIGGNSDDMIVFEVVDAETGHVVFETGIQYFDEENSLDGTARSVTLPAGTLTPGRSYEATLRFMDMEHWSQSGAYAASFHNTELATTLRAVTRHANPAIDSGILGRWTAHQQTGSNTINPIMGEGAAWAYTVIWMESRINSNLTSAVLNEQHNLVQSSDGEDWSFRQPVSSVEELLSWLPNGEHTLDYVFNGGSAHLTTLTLIGDLPDPVRISNWDELQWASADTVTTVRWIEPPEVRDFDAYIVTVYAADGSGTPIFETDLDFKNGTGLFGGTTSVAIPAGTLDPGKIHQATINFMRFTDVDRNSQTGASFVAANGVETQFTINTGALVGNDPPTVDTLLLEDGFEGQIYACSVQASDPEDGFHVSLRAPILPGWLTFVDQGSGVGSLSGTLTSGQAGVYTVAIEVADGQGLTAVRRFSLTVNPDLSDPEGRALDIGPITWLRDPASPFEVQITEVQYGESALVTGAVSDGATSFLQGSFIGPATLSFTWKVSSQAGKDFLRVEVDDTVEAEISGEQNWRQQVVSLPAGTHSVVWSYVKDGAGSSGTDRGWLDHVTVLPAEAGVYAGTYLGEIASSTGEVALAVRPDHTAVFLGYHPESGQGLSQVSFRVSSEGTFSFEVVGRDDMNTKTTVSGSIRGGVASGSVSGLDLSFTADQVSGGGQLVSYDGYYPNALTGTTTGMVHLIVATDGRVYCQAEDGVYVEGLITSIDATGRIAMTTVQGAEYDLKIDPATDQVTGQVTTPGGEVLRVLGIREGSPGDELLANISTRGQVLDEDQVMIASFVITGSGSKQLLIRAIGPKLGDFGVGGVLPDPTIDLIRFGQTELMDTNDNWSDTEEPDRVVSESVRLGAFALDEGGLDSVLLLSLEPGAYTATVKGNGGLTGVGLVEVFDADDPSLRRSTAEVVNIATRGQVGTGADVLIAGFVVSGNVPKRVLIRGIGPQLGVYGVSGVLEDPRLDLMDSTQNLVASNDDWGDSAEVAAVAGATSEVGAFALDAGSKDAVLLIWLKPGAYTAQVSGADGGTGVALIEVYEF